MIEHPTAYSNSDQAVVKTRCYLYEFVYKGINYHFTNFDIKINYGENTYLPIPIKHSEVSREKGELSIDLTISNVFLKQFFLSTPTVYLFVNIVRVVNNIPNPTLNDTYKVFTGFVSSFTFNGAYCSVGCASNVINDNNRLPKHMCQHQCNYKLYSPLCGVNRDTYTFDSTILSFNTRSKTILLSTFIDNTKLSNGILKHNGLDYMINKSSTVSGTSQLTMVDMPIDLTAADEVKVSYGCMKTVGNCADTFNNLPNYGGFPTIPTKNPGIDGVS